MKKILITGATGFLGKYLVELFHDHGYYVVASGRNTSKGQLLVKENVEFIACDLEDKESVKRLLKEIDYVVHAAALSSAWGAYEDFYKINVLGTRNIVDACCNNHVERLVFVSSPSVYASKKDQFNIKENQAPEVNKLNYYIETKLLAEKEVKKGLEKDLYTVVIRPRGIFGVGDPSIVPRILEVNEKMGIPLFNDGKQMIDITYVSNVAYSILLAIEKNGIKGETFNITNGQPLEFSAIVDLLFDNISLEKKYKIMNPKAFYILASIIELFYKTFRLKKEPILTRYKATTLLYSQTLCIEHAQEKLGYKPLVSVEDGIKIYGEWWHKNDR